MNEIHLSNIEHFWKQTTCTTLKKIAPSVLESSVFKSCKHLRNLLSQAQLTLVNVPSLQIPFSQCPGAMFSKQWSCSRQQLSSPYLITQTINFSYKQQRINLLL